MRFGPKVLMLLGVIAVGGYLASKVADPPHGEPKEVSFRLTPLTVEPFPLQHGILNYITLNMTESGNSEAIRITDPPEFPMISTLHYETVDGQKRKVSSSYGYRC